MTIARQSRQMRKAQARRMAKNFIANMKVRDNDGMLSSLNSPRALKVVERGMTKLIVENGFPFAMQISLGEAACLLVDDVDPSACYAMAFAVDCNGHPYCTLPVGCRPHANYRGPAISAVELAEEAERAAYRELINERFGIRPHVPRHLVGLPETG